MFRNWKNPASWPCGTGPGNGVGKKICSLACGSIVFNLDGNPGISPSDEISLPVGQFSQVQVKAPCGICTSSERLGKVNDVRTFYHPEKVNAQRLWFTTGFLECEFPRLQEKDSPARFLEFSAELCSEVPYFNTKAESDISFQINGNDAGIWHSPGDFGGKRGRLTPAWWGRHKTQYGQLVTLTGVWFGNAVQRAESIGLEHRRPPVGGISRG